MGDQGHAIDMPQEVLGETDQTVAHVDDPILDLIRNKLPSAAVNVQSEGTIIRVRPSIRNGSESFYTPKLVSIGPYHSDEGKFKQLQEVKLKYLSDLIRRDAPHNKLQNYISIVRSLAEDARKQYSEVVTVDDDKFAMMLVVDGCFIIELLVKIYLNDRNSQAVVVKANLPALRTELLLVENQIPFTILEALFKASNIPELEMAKSDSFVMLLQLAIVFFGYDKGDANGLARKFVSDEKSSPHHLLQLFHVLLDDKYQPESYRFDPSYLLKALDFFMELRNTISKRIKSIPIKIITYPLTISWNITCIMLFIFWLSFFISWLIAVLMLLLISNFWWCIKSVLGMLLSVTEDYRGRPQGIPSARYLREAGFSFQASKPAPCNFVIFYGGFHGVAIIVPELSIEEPTCVLFKNLFAFENSATDLSTYRFTIFASEMDSFIDVEKDVAILKESGIIESRTLNDAEIASFFNNLCNGVDIDNERVLSVSINHVARQYKWNYYQNTFYRWMRKVSPDYFTNPLALPSMVAAFILLTLAAAQTYFTIYPYYHPRS